MYVETYRNYKANGELRREKVEDKKYIEWLPKSQIELQNGYIFVKDWLVKEKNDWYFRKLKGEKEAIA